MDTDTLTAIGVVAGVVGAVVTVLALVPPAVSWWRNRKKPKVDERIAVSTEQIERNSAAALELERAKQRQALMARFELRHDGTKSNQHAIEWTALLAKNIGAHRAEHARFGIGPHGTEPQMDEGGRTVEPDKVIPKRFYPRLDDSQSAYDVVLQYRDGTGERRQTFTVHYKRNTSNQWKYGGITETTDAP